MTVHALGPLTPRLAQPPAPTLAVGSATVTIVRKRERANATACSTCGLLFYPLAPGWAGDDGPPASTCSEGHQVTYARVAPGRTAFPRQRIGAPTITQKELG